MRTLRTIFSLSLLLALALALAGCRKDPSGPSIGTLMVTPVAASPCGYWSGPVFQRMQQVDCGY
jgi:hypothetical protein